MRWLDRALFVSPYHYGLCCSEKDFHKELARLEVKRDGWPPFLSSPHAHATLHTFDRQDGKALAIITLGSTKGRSIPQVHAMLVHEATHLWQYIKQHTGETEPSSEFEAYAIQTISQRLMEAYEEYSAKQQKKPKKRNVKKQ